ALVAAGVKQETVARVLRGVVMQRLLRRLCDACAVPVTEPLTAEEMRLERTYGTRPVRRAVGCELCGGTGYGGVLPIAQVLLVTPRIAELIAIAATAGQLEAGAAEGGMRTLVAAA